MASVSDSCDHVFRAPLTDPGTLPSATGGYFWRLEDTRNTAVDLKNVTDRPQRYRLVLRHADGIWEPGVHVLPARQSTTIDLAAVRQTQETDAHGGTVPLSVSTGQVHWSIVGGRDYRGLIGRVVQVDIQHGVSSTYACPMPTADDFYDAWIQPGYQYDFPGNRVKFTVMEQDHSPANSLINEIPGPDVYVIARAPAQPAPSTMPMAAISSSTSSGDPWTTPNPYLMEVPATDLEFFDQHTTAQPFVQPYSSVQLARVRCMSTAVSAPSLIIG